MPVFSTKGRRWKSTYFEIWAVGHEQPETIGRPGLSCVTCVVSTCVGGRNITWSGQPWEQAIWNKRSCSLHALCGALSLMWLFRKMPVNQKPLIRIGIFWYQFTPRKLLYLLVSLNLVKFGPHWLSVFFGPPCIYRVSPQKRNARFSLLWYSKI